MIVLSATVGLHIAYYEFSGVEATIKRKLISMNTISITMKIMNTITISTTTSHFSPLLPLLPPLPIVYLPLSREQDQLSPVNEFLLDKFKYQIVESKPAC